MAAMAPSRTLRPYLPILLAAILSATILLLVILEWDLRPLLIYGFIIAMSFTALAGSVLRERIVLSENGIEFHRPGELTLTMPRPQIAEFAFSANQFVVTTVGGVTITVSTAWYTGRQRDAVIAHLRAPSVA